MDVEKKRTKAIAWLKGHRAHMIIATTAIAVALFAAFCAVALPSEPSEADAGGGTLIAGETALEAADEEDVARGDSAQESAESKGGDSRNTDDGNDDDGDSDPVAAEQSSEGGTGSSSSDNGKKSSSASVDSSSSSSGKSSSKKWVEDTERVWVVDEEAWTEEVPVYETVECSICNICGDDITGNTSAHNKVHMLAGEGSGYHSETKRVQTGSETVEHAEEGHWETIVIGGHWE